MLQLAEKHKRIIDDSASRLLGRAGNSRRLTLELVGPRVAGVLAKYLLRDSPDATNAEINEFLDALNADDLCSSSPVKTATNRHGATWLRISI